MEEVDKAFLKRHYGASKGMLLKPEGTQGLEYKGEDWKDYAWYEPKTDVSEGDQAALIGLTRLIHQADDKQFRSEIGTFLDTDQFARFLAANTLLSNMDSFLTQVHNYYLYCRRTRRSLSSCPGTWISPWGRSSWPEPPNSCRTSAFVTRTWGRID